MGRVREGKGGQWDTREGLWRGSFRERWPVISMRITDVTRKRLSDGDNYW